MPRSYMNSSNKPLNKKKAYQATKRIGNSGTRCIYNLWLTDNERAAAGGSFHCKLPAEPHPLPLFLRKLR